MQFAPFDAFVDALDLAGLGFDGVEPAATERPAFHPSVLLKLYIYGYLNRVQSSRRLEREAGRNLELLWLLGRLVPDHKTIADFRKDNGEALRRVCAHFVGLCRDMGLLATASVAIDGSKFKAVNNRDKNFTKGKVERRRAQLEQSVARYLAQLDTADRQPTEALAAKAKHLKEKLVKLKGEMDKLSAYEKQMLASPDQQISLTDPDSRSMATSGRGSGVVGYNVQVAVETKNHLIVTHEVTMSGSDRSNLARVSKAAKAVMPIHSKLSPIPVTSTAPRFWSATRLASARLVARHDAQEFVVSRPLAAARCTEPLSIHCVERRVRPGLGGELSIPAAELRNPFTL